MKYGFVFSFLLVSYCPYICVAQEKPTNSVILKMDQTVDGPFGGQKSRTCMRVYADGKVLYASWWNSAATFVDPKTGEKSRPEHTASTEYRLEEYEIYELTEFLNSKPIRRLAAYFGPPHRPIDYFETTQLQVLTARGKPKQITTREYYVADLVEKSRYPSALVVLMERINQIEEKAGEKGQSAPVPPDCRLKP